MVYKDIMPIALCVLLTAMIFYAMFKKSSVAESFDEFIDRKNDVNVKAPTRKNVLKQEVEGFQSSVSHNNPDNEYSNRLMVLKMFDSLGQKPTKEELDRISSMPSKADIMQHMVNVASHSSIKSIPIKSKNGEKENFYEAVKIPDEADKPRVIIVDADDVYSPVNLETPIKKFMDINQPLAANEHEVLYEVSDSSQVKSPLEVVTPIATGPLTTTTQPETKKSENAKKYVKEVYDLLGKIDQEIDIIST